MLAQRPVLIGMNNTESPNPELALFPHPRGSTGHRLWLMAQRGCSLSRERYLELFDRRNLLSTPDYDAGAAAEAGMALWPTLAGRTVVVLGQAVRVALLLERTPMLLWSESERVRWCWVPHPSGLCRDYNEPLIRIAVGLRIAELAEESERLLK